MKFKKLVIIPASVLCLGALFSCNKNNTPFPGLKNGYESVEFEKYFNLPSNLFTIEQRYGDYIQKSAMLNSLLNVRTMDTKLLETGTSPFFANFPMFTPGTNKKTRVFGLTSQIDNGVYAGARKTPFSTNATQISAQSTTKYYGSKETKQVMQQKETSSRSYYVSVSNSTVYTDPVNTEKVFYTEEKTGNQKELFVLQKGSSELETGRQQGGEAYEDVTYRTSLGKDSSTKTEEKLNTIVTDNFNTQMYDVLNAGAECASITHLSRINDPESNASKGYEDDLNFSYLSNGTDCVYCYGTATSPLSSVPIYDVPTGDQNAAESTTVPVVPAFDTVEYMIKLRYASINNSYMWLCDEVSASFKTYVLQDQNLNKYGQPKCFCSEYRHLDLSYNDLGDFGEIEQAELYNSPNYYVRFTATNLDEKVGSDDSFDVEYDPFTDQNLYKNGTIYDHTFAARKSNLIAQDEYLYYGSLELGRLGGFINEAGDTYSSTNYRFKISLVKPNESGVEEVIVVKPNENTINNTTQFPDAFKIYGDESDNSIEVKLPENDSTYRLLFYIKFKKEGEQFNQKEYSIEITAGTIGGGGQVVPTDR